MTQDLRTILSDQATGTFHALARHRRKLDKLAGLAETLVCPVEGAAPGLSNRFCTACFGEVPNLLHRPPFATAAPSNESIGVGFAEALRSELAARGIAVAGADRACFVKLAQRRKLPPSLAALMPAGFAPDDLAPGLDLLQGYYDVLYSYGVSVTERASAIQGAERQYRALLDRPVASVEEMAELRGHAAAVIEAALQTCRAS